ncbi:hypothetical protein TSHO111613_22765 [Tsukamurella hominis]
MDFSMPLHIDFRLIGPSTDGGGLPASAGSLLPAFQEELSAALPGPGSVDFVIADVSEGSAIVHFRPVLPSPDDRSNEISVPDSTECEQAILKVIELHSWLETQEPSPRFARERKGLLDKLERVTKDLRDNNLDLEITANGHDGRRHRSTLTRGKGLAWARQVFDAIGESETKPGKVKGLVVAVDADANEIVVRGGPKGGRVTITDVPHSSLTNHDIQVDQDVIVIVSVVTSKDSVGRSTSKARRFVSIEHTLTSE